MGIGKWFELITDYRLLITILNPSDSGEMNHSGIILGGRAIGSGADNAVGDFNGNGVAKLNIICGREVVRLVLLQAGDNNRFAATACERSVVDHQRGGGD